MATFNKKNAVLSSSSLSRWQEDLSPELWVQIGSWLSPCDILQSVVLVSKQFRRLLGAEHFWKFYTKQLLLQLQLPCHQPVDNVAIANDERLAFIATSLSSRQRQRLAVFLVAQKISNESRHNTNNSTTTTTARYDRNQQDDSTFYPPGLQFGSLLLDRSMAVEIRNRARRRVCLASSTDHPTEFLENVLSGTTTMTNVYRHDNRIDHDDDHVEMLRNVGLWEIERNLRLQWWSSRPSPTPDDTQDTLLFVTNCSLAVLSHIKLRPLLDPFTRGQVYSWRECHIKAYRLPRSQVMTTSTTATIRHIRRLNHYRHNDETTTHNIHRNPLTEEIPCTVPASHRRLPIMGGDHDNDGDLQLLADEPTALQQVVLQDETPVFCSPPLFYAASSPRSQSQELVPWQTFRFPPGVMANAVTVTLVGKHSRQFRHSGYYACVQQVQLEGISLTPTEM